MPTQQPHLAVRKICFTPLLLLILITVLPASASAQTFSKPTRPLPVTGPSHPSTNPIDQKILKFMNTHDVVGASFAIAKDGKLLYAKGFGFANLKSFDPVKPTSLFRIASVSKPITAVAVMQLIQEKKLNLGQPAFSLLSHIKPAKVKKPTYDPRLKNITVQHLLNHTAGWDRSKSGDAMTSLNKQIAKALQLNRSPNRLEIIQWALTQTLDTRPGSHYAYSNLGYNILARLIEKQTKSPYHQYVQKHIFKPLKIKDMHIGSTSLKGRRKNEVLNYFRMPQADPDAHSRFKLVYETAGIIENYEAHGGWIASAVDLVRFASALTDINNSPLLSADAIRQMFARPSEKLWLERKTKKPLPYHYAAGWMVRPQKDKNKFTAWHAGYIPGTSTLLVKRADGYTWAILFNNSRSRYGKSLSAAIDSSLHKIINAQTAWPKQNLFSKFN